MYIRQTRKEEVKEVVEIINAAADFIASQGSPQWQNGQKPTKETILNDIERKESYVLIVEDQIVGTAALVSGVDPVYTKIDCSWKKSTGPYLSIHRVALAESTRGKKLAKPFLEQLLTIAASKDIQDVRIDTYPANEPMEKTIYSAGFTYQGMIEFPFEHGERKAYQKIIK